MTVFDNGSSPSLYVGGIFNTAGGVVSRSIARWDGNMWSPLIIGMPPIGFNNRVTGLAVFDDGSGPALYAGGIDVAVGFGFSGIDVGKWDGHSWSQLDSAIAGSSFVASIGALAAFDDGTGPALFAGGMFTTSVTGDGILAKYQGCAISNPADLTGDGIVNATDLATLLTQWGPCPPSPSACAADLNDDGDVDAVDLAALIANWG